MTLEEAWIKEGRPRFFTYTDGKVYRRLDDDTFLEVSKTIENSSFGSPMPEEHGYYPPDPPRSRYDRR
jgi:hypothetical protein